MQLVAGRCGANDHEGELVLNTYCCIGGEQVVVKVVEAEEVEEARDPGPPTVRPTYGYVNFSSCQSIHDFT